MGKPRMRVSRTGGVAPDNTEGMSDQQVFETHNHETARNFPAEKQCGCVRCEAHRQATDSDSTE